MWRCRWHWRTPREPRCCSSGSSSCSCRTWTPSPTTCTSPWSSTTTTTVRHIGLCWSKMNSSVISCWVKTSCSPLHSHSCWLPATRLQGRRLWQPLVWRHGGALQGGRGADGLPHLERARVCGAKPAQEASRREPPEGDQAGYSEESSREGNDHSGSRRKIIKMHLCFIIKHNIPSFFALSFSQKVLNLAKSVRFGQFSCTGCMQGL